MAKVWALTESSIPGEAEAARQRAEVILKRAGKTLADAPELLRRKLNAIPEPAFVFYDMDDPRQAAAYKEHRRQKHAAWVREHAAET
ncbi:MAG: Lrp/AsnC family transcriptional regulator, partial [Stellaceae bacterium]